MENVVEKFNSISALLKMLESRPQNPAIESASSERTDKEKVRAAETKDYQEAKKLLLNGYKKALPDFQKSVKAIRTTSKRSTYTAPRGYAPHVPNAIQGKPNSMLASKMTHQKTRTMELYYNISVSCGVSASRMTEAGKNLVAAIKNAERQNIRIKLHCIFFCGHVGQNAIGTVLLKDYSQPLNLLKMTFPLVHPSMLRRIGFKWLETNPQTLSEDFDITYGQVQDDNPKIKKLLKADKAVVLSYCDIAGLKPDEITKKIFSV